MIINTLLLIAAALIVWYAANVLLLAFAAILLAIALHAIGYGVNKFTKIPYMLALSIGIVLIFGILFIVFWLYSPLITKQVQLLVEQIPQALGQLREISEKYFYFPKFDQLQLTKELVENIKIFDQVTKIFSFTLGSIVNFVIFILVGAYIAYNPSSYLDFIMHIIPRSNHGKVKKTMANVTLTLRWWLFGKLLTMIAIGTLTFIGLLILDISLAFILGLLAGLLAFIPYIGPIISSFPAILIALTKSPATALYTIFLYMFVHFLEGYFVTPFVEKKTVSLPPGVVIIMEVLMAVLLGFLGLALASPLTVVLIVLARQIYVKGAKSDSSESFRKT